MRKIKRIKMIIIIMKKKRKEISLDCRFNMPYIFLDACELFFLNSISKHV